MPSNPDPTYSWYTADGTSDPLSATVNSYNLINSLDGLLVRIGHAFQYLLSIELADNTEATPLEPTS